MKDKKTQILEAALKLFTEQGFYNTPTSQIAKEANVATGTLFHYFKNKEELINALFLDCKNAMAEAIIKDLDQETDYKSKMKKAWFNAIEWGLGKTEQYLFMQQFSNSPFITKITQDEAKSRFTITCDLYNKGKELGLIKNLPTEIIILVVAGVSSSTINFIVNSCFDLNVSDYLEEIFNCMWDAIKK